MMKQPNMTIRRMNLNTNNSSVISSILAMRLNIPPSLTWLVVFVPTLAYLVSTRLGHQARGVLGEPLLHSHSVQLVVLGRRDSDTYGYYDPATVTAACIELAKVFYSSSSSCSTNSDGVVTSEFESKQGDGVMVVLQNMNGIVDSVWRHDSELGRGYLLLSSSHGKGRVWRWEVGGGPIAIGKTLHLEDAGCRSNLHRPCNNNNDEDEDAVGSGALAIDFMGKEHYSEGRLVVAEWGEGRVVRLEENGARTPLVLQLPHYFSQNNGCHDDITNTTTGNQLNDKLEVKRATEEENQQPQPLQTTTMTGAATTTTRVKRPTQLLYTPFGDLLLVEEQTTTQMKQKDEECGGGGSNSSSNKRTLPKRAALFRLPLASHVEPLASLSESRVAHSWTSLEQPQPNSHATNNNNGTLLPPQQDEHGRSSIRLPELVPLGEDVMAIGGIAVTHEWTSIYVVVTRQPQQQTSSSGSSQQVVSLVKVPLYEDEEEDEDSEDEDQDETGENEAAAAAASKKKSARLLRNEPEVVIDLSPYYHDVSVSSSSSSDNKQQKQQQTERPGSIAVSQNHVFVVVSNGVLVIDPVKRIVLGKLEIASTSSSSSVDRAVENDVGGSVAASASTAPPFLLTSLTMGEDGYLYMTTRTSLLRIRLRPQIMPVKVPTDLVPKKKKERPSSATTT